MITRVDIVVSQDGGETETRFNYTIKGGSTADAVCIALDYLEVDLLAGDGDLQNYALVLTARPADDVIELPATVAEILAAEVAA